MSDAVLEMDKKNQKKGNSNARMMQLTNQLNQAINFRKKLQVKDSESDESSSDSENS